eukprot:PhM_4_TR13227/c0_g1_i1/m.56557/K00428/E1.11.1.5; cytochrome c peroxidase
MRRWVSVVNIQNRRFAAASSLPSSLVMSFSAAAGSASNSTRNHANPHMNRPVRHRYFLGMCLAAGILGVAAGQVVDIDHQKLPNAFIKEDIEEELRKTFDFRPELAASMLRLTFLYGLERGTNAPVPQAVKEGLADARAVVHGISLRHVLSHEDALTLAATTALEYLGGPRVMWRCGRSTSGRKKKPRTDIVVPPSPVDCTLGEWLDVFEKMGFSHAEFVALMGAHTVGSMQELPKTIETKWTRDNYTFNNAYFRNLLELEYKAPKYDSSKILVGCGRAAMKHSLGILPWEQALVSDDRTKEYVRQYATDEQEWMAQFTRAFVRLTELGDAGQLREYVPPPSMDKVRALTASKTASAVKEGNK